MTVSTISGASGNFTVDGSGNISSPTISGLLTTTNAASIYLS